MAKKENVFEPPAREFLDTLTNLRHGSTANEWIVGQGIEMGRQVLSTASEDVKARVYGLFGVGDALLIQDFTNPSEWQHVLCYKTRNAKNEELLDLAQEMERRLHGQILCAAFEIAERFMQRVAALTHFQSRNRHGEAIVKFEKSRFHRSHPKWRSAKHGVGTLSYFDAYVRWAYRDGFGAFLERLTNHLPFCTKNDNYRYWMGASWWAYRRVEFCRHQIVHAFGAYQQKALNRLDQYSKDAIVQMTRVSVLTGENCILPDRSQVADQIKDLAGMGLHVHRGLSSAFNMEPMALPEQKTTDQR